MVAPFEGSRLSRHSTLTVHESVRFALMKRSGE